MIGIIAKRKKPLWLRVLIVLLVAVILIASPVRVLSEAHAVVLVDDAAIGVVAILLAAAGYTFANADTLSECASNLWQGMSGNSELKMGLLSVAQIWLENQGQVNIWKVSASLKDLFLDFIGNKYNPAMATFENVYAEQLINAQYDSSGGTPSASSVTKYISPERFLYTDLATGNKHELSMVTDNHYLRVLWDGETIVEDILLISMGSEGVITPVGWFFRGSYFNYICIKYAYQFYGGNVVYGTMDVSNTSNFDERFTSSYLNAYDCNGDLLVDYAVTVPDIAKQDFKDLPDEPVLSLPATTNITNIYNSTYADVTSPTYQLSQEEIAGLTADVPTTTADTGTGEGTGAGTISGTLQGLWDWLKGILQSILQGILSIPAALAGILDAILSFFDSPINFQLNFEGFKNLILFNRFPFCIPFDLKNAISVFASNASDYKLSIDMDTGYFSVHQEIDLTPFALPIAFFRYGASVWFTIALILKTRELIKW